VAVRLRLGVRLLVRVPGRLVRHVELGRLHVRKRRMVVWISNRGNVAVPLARQVTATLLRHGRVAARLRPRAAALLLPGGRVAMTFAYTRGVRGLFTVEVRVGRDVRRYRVRL
jgi:hypothetical protein